MLLDIPTVQVYLTGKKKCEYTIVNEKMSNVPIVWAYIRTPKIPTEKV